MKNGKNFFNSKSKVFIPKKKIYDKISEQMKSECGNVCLPWTVPVWLALIP